jgi:hypothetical protein
MSGGAKLSRSQERAIAALLSEPTIEAAAARAKISPRTLAYWLKQPAFAAAYRQARQQLVEHAVTLLQRTTSLAVATLCRNLSCGKPGVEVNAANSILQHSTAAIEQFDILSRLEALEARAAQQAGGNHAFNGAASNGEARGAGR